MCHDFQKFLALFLLLMGPKLDVLRDKIGILTFFVKKFKEKSLSSTKINLYPAKNVCFPYDPSTFWVNFLCYLLFGSSNVNSSEP